MTGEIGSDPRLPVLHWLWGARVQRIDAPEPSLFVFTLFERGRKESLIASVSAEKPGVGVVTERPQGQPASAFVRRLRGLVEGGRLEKALAWVDAEGARASAIELRFLRHAESVSLLADFDPQLPNLFILKSTGELAGAGDERARHQRFGRGPYQPPTRALITVPSDAQAALASGKKLLEDRAQSTRLRQLSAARAQLKAALKRAERKEAAIRGDLTRAAAAPQLRREAEVLLCHLSQVPRGASSVELEDISRDPPVALVVPLDPALTPEQNAEAKFARARRLGRGLSIASERLKVAERETAELREQLATLQAGEASAALPAQVITRGTPRSHAGKQPIHVPYRIFEGVNQTRILVGKGAADNDALTLTVAKPHDLWLHARGIHGAHVVVPRAKQEPISPDVLLDAAHLAAHFSDARGERVVEIQHTERRYVRKQKGAAPGAVRIDRERTLLLRVEPERVKRLLGSERFAAP